MNKAFFAIALTVLLSACATVGKEVSADQAAQFEKGKTTKAEISPNSAPQPDNQ